MENIGKDCKKKEVNEFQKILNENEILRKLDDLIKEANLGIALAIEALATGEEKNPDGTVKVLDEKEKQELLKNINDCRRLVVDCIGMHHDIVMALYAGFVNDDSPTSASKNRYW